MGTARVGGDYGEPKEPQEGRTAGHGKENGKNRLIRGKWTSPSTTRNATWGSYKAKKKSSQGSMQGKGFEVSGGEKGKINS